MSNYDKVNNKFEEPLNKVLEVFISLGIVALGAITFLQIMMPIESSPLYPLGGFLRFGLFVTTLFLIMFFIANPLFKTLKVKT